jgi:hypothetical protein
MREVGIMYSNQCAASIMGRDMSRMCGILVCLESDAGGEVTIFVAAASDLLRIMKREQELTRTTQKASNREPQYKPNKCKIGS